jgi:hypothetical protein
MQYLTPRLKTRRFGEAGAVGWGCGIRYYLVLLLTGLAGYMGWIQCRGLPADRWCWAPVASCGVCRVFADKIHGLDSL